MRYISVLAAWRLNFQPVHPHRRWAAAPPEAGAPAERRIPATWMSCASWERGEQTEPTACEPVSYL